MGLLFIMFSLATIYTKDYSAFIPFGISFLGVILNFLAIYKNDWKMPVYLPFDNEKLNKKISSSSAHQDISEKWEARYFYLCDIFGLHFPSPKKTKTFVLFFSIGDILLILGIIFAFARSFL